MNKSSLSGSEKLEPSMSLIPVIKYRYLIDIRTFKLRISKMQMQFNNYFKETKMQSNVIKKQKQILVEHYIRSDEGKKMLDIYEAMTIQMLASYMGDKNECWEKQEELASVCRMSVRHFRRVINKLEKEEIIKVKRTKDRNYYSFNEFWLSEIEHFSMHCFAADSYLSTKSLNNKQVKPDSQSSRPDCESSLTIYNNIINNRRVIHSQKPDEIKSTIKFWESGHPDYDRVNN